MIPNNWKKVILKNILSQSIQNGYSPQCPEQETGKWTLTLGALNENGLDISQKKPAPKNDSKIKKYYLSSGDFLISRSNTLDKVGRSSLFKGEIKNCAYPDLIMRFRVLEEQVFPGYLERYLYSKYALKYIRSCAAGTSSSMVKINKSILERLPVILPPLEEQKKIAEILSTWDKAIALTEKLIAAKQKLKKGLMQKLLNDKHKDKIWKKGRLGDLIASLDAGVSVNSIDRCIKNHEIGILKTSAVTYGIFLPEEHKVVIDREKNRVTISPQKDRIIISRMNTPTLVGASVYIEHNYPFLFLPDRLWQTKGRDDSFSMQWLSYFLSLENTRFRISSIATGTSNSMKNISKKSLLNLKLLIPPLDEQKLMVNVFSTLDIEIKFYKDKLLLFQKQKRGLMQKLLTGEWRVNIEKEVVNR